MAVVEGVPTTPATPASKLDSGWSTPASHESSVSSHEITRDDVAIIGMACRTAGGNDTPEKLWQFLMDKKDASGPNPSWRWEPWAKRDPRNAKIIEKTISTGYFIPDLENFDAAFFNISPKEAEQMDPHQRLGLEVTWEALEDAGLDPKSLSGSDTAVYMGVDSDDYSRLLLEDIPNIEAWMGIGTTAHGIPNRISYHYDLMGPSVAVDAACASSLCAVHAGRQAVLNGESKVAIVGGVNVCLSPALFHMLGAAGALSPDGVCLSFDDDAHGYARGEGAAVLILKRLSDAIVDGDRVLATLKGTAIAQDGKTNGIMAPNAKAQELVARKALKVADVDPLSVGYVEAHATSTSLGDPTEISAISAVYGAGRSQDTPVHVGSIKPNVGHLEAAAGAISLVKAVMAVSKGEIPPQTRLNKLNTRVDWDKSGLQIVREKVSWDDAEGPRRAAVCSYGYGGTVSHAIIEQSPLPAAIGHKMRSGAPTLLVLSAPQEKRLAIQSAVQAEWMFDKGHAHTLETIASTLALRRAHHDHRAAFVVSSHEEAAEALSSFTNGTAGDWSAQGRSFASGPSREAVWVFSGHGAQWADMGKELLLDPVFYQAVSPLDDIVLQELGYSAIETLEAGNFQDSDVIQVLTYLVQIGLSEILKSKGVQPRAIIGHSVGEIAASVVAGCLDPSEGALIVTRRARLYAQVKGLGGMALVNLPFAEVAADLSGREDLVAAIHSSPSSCVVSGAVGPLAEYEEKLKQRGVRTFTVKTDIAFHSPMLASLSAPLEATLAEVLRPQPPLIKLYSTSIKDSRSHVMRDAAYWVNNMVNPVWLNSAVDAAVEDGHRVFLEVSTHPIVSHSINETLGEADLTEYAVIPTMKKNQPAEKSILHAIAQLYVTGAQVSFTALVGSQWCTEVPGFAWTHKPFWKEVSTGVLGDEGTHDVDMHTLLGKHTVVAGTSTSLYTSKVTDETKPFPRDHRLHGTNIVPFAVYVNTFLHGTKATVISDMTLRVPLAIADAPRNIQVVVEDGNVKIASRLSSSDDKAWVSHSAASWSAKPLEQTTTPPVDLDTIKKRIGKVLPSSFSIDYLTKVGVAGIAFPWAVTEHYGNSREMIARVDADPDNAEVTWHPSSWAAVFDAASSVGATIFSDDAKLRIVSRIDKAMLYSSQPAPKTCYLYVVETEAVAEDPLSRSADVSILSEEGGVLAKFEGLTLTEVNPVQRVSQGIEGLVHQLAWVPPRLSEKPLAADQVVLISEDSQLLARYKLDLAGKFPEIIALSSVQELNREAVFKSLQGNTSAVVYCPGSIGPDADVAASAQKFIWDVATAIKTIVHNCLATKFFIVTDQVFAADSATALAQGPLYGLARVVALEHSDIWGGLIDSEGPAFPLLPFKYVPAYDIVRLVDGLPRVARMRPFAKDQLLPASSNKTLLPKPEGAYVMTGGLGVLGLETCDWLIEKGARRIVIISRRALPPRSQWAAAVASEAKIAPILKRIQAMESVGASIHVVSLDIGADDAHDQLLAALERLSLPPVLGVIHASGVLEDSLLCDTTADSFARVLSPKISGALALHRAFPPAAGLDFFVLFSSIGQLVGTSGQSSYGAGNAFLDTLAAHRRGQGDNAIAFQWTAWRAMGMGTSDFLALELQSKGITDITRSEGFQAWEHMSKYDVDQVVVTRTRTLDADEPLPCPLLEDIAVRRSSAQSRTASSSAATPAAAEAGQAGDSGDARPTNAAELIPWLNLKLRECLASILKMDDIEEIDDHVALTDLGVDSVMTIVLRQKLQSVFKVKVPQTLTWNYPTVVAMVDWFSKQFDEAA
uniref:6-methylsalicylic acid synthase n=1 Tax=Pestalotiopsis microspora TaxID=85828 RepID=A0A1P8NTK2_PESMI|nr:polyketide synthase [Pestalotiopsis microspora]